ncbi:MAG: FoF1 ATP synthase subunit gamma [Oscillospiraceae bacterium]
MPACLLITADKGLAGAYNQNAIRQAQQLLTAQGNAALYVVGEYGRRWFSQRGIAIEESFHYTAQNPTLDRARHIAELLLERFDAGEISAVWVIYTDMKNGLEAVVRQETTCRCTGSTFTPPRRLPPGIRRMSSCRPQGRCWTTPPAAA